MVLKETSLIPLPDTFAIIDKVGFFASSKKTNENIVFEVLEDGLQNCKGRKQIILEAYTFRENLLILSFIIDEINKYYVNYFIDLNNNMSIDKITFANY